MVYFNDNNFIKVGDYAIIKIKSKKKANYLKFACQLIDPVDWLPTQFYTQLI